MRMRIGETIRLPDFAAIDAYIEAEISATHIPGLALAIVQGDQIAHLRGFGMADPAGD
jgi:CubicO group peptidase (beta-lactamase class C family)